MRVLGAHLDAPYPRKVGMGKPVVREQKNKTSSCEALLSSASRDAVAHVTPSTWLQECGLPDP